MSLPKTKNNISSLHKQFLNYFTYFTLVIFSGSFLLVIIPSAPVIAAGEQYVFTYPKDDASGDKLQNLYKDKLSGDEANDGILSNTAMYAKGGFWSRLQPKPVPLKYNGSKTKNLDNFFSTQGRDDHGFMYQTSYICYDNGAKVAPLSEANTLKQSYFQVNVVLGLYVNGDKKDFRNQNTYETSVWVDGVVYNGPAPTAAGEGENTPDREVKKYYTDYDEGITDIEDTSERDLGRFTKVIIEKSGIKGGCLPPYDIGFDSKKKADNYYKVAGAWKDISQDEIDNPSISGGTGSGDEDVAGCDTFSGSPLGWIICPVIELGTDFNNLVYKDIVTPLMDTTPVNLDADNGAYRAWQGFRIIANAMLVLAMLAIVYYQAKGGE